MAETHTTEPTVDPYDIDADIATVEKIVDHLRNLFPDVEREIFDDDDRAIFDFGAFGELLPDDLD